MAKRGSIHSNQVCPVCGSRFKHSKSKGLPPIPKGLAFPDGLFCPNHIQIKPTKYVVRLDNITKRFNSYEAAEDFLAGLNFKRRSGEFDARDYQIKSRPLSFISLSEEWLELKASQIKPGSLRAITVDIKRAQKAWGHVNIKSILYPQIEDFFKGHDGRPKTRANCMSTLKQFFEWAHDRYSIEPIKKWPKLGPVEMAFRKTIDLQTQDAVIEDVRKHEPLRVWLCIKWLATYISIRPGEMRGLKEGQVDRQRGILIIPHPKEKRPKIIPLVPEDIEIVRTLPLAFDQSMPFFRHEDGRKITAGTGFGQNVLYRSWKRACQRLGVDGVSLYPGTKHSTATGLRSVLTPEQIKSITLHSTSQAFNRYFQTGGEALRDLQSTRRNIIDADNALITDQPVLSSPQVINFSKK